MRSEKASEPASIDGPENHFIKAVGLRARGGGLQDDALSRNPIACEAVPDTLVIASPAIFIEPQPGGVEILGRLQVRNVYDDVIDSGDLGAFILFLR